MTAETRKILERSVVGKDFLKHRVHPNNDRFLDYRLALKDMLELPFESKDYPDEWVEREIKAVDEILKLIN